MLSLKKVTIRTMLVLSLANILVILWIVCSRIRIGVVQERCLPLMRQAISIHVHGLHKYSLRNKKAWIIGNVYDGIDPNKLRPFLTLDRCTQSTQECIDCEVAGGCAWCQGENYDAAETPTIYQRSTAICKMHKARVRANNYYWNKLHYKLR